MKKVKRILSSLLAVTALVTVCLAPRALAISATNSAIDQSHKTELDCIEDIKTEFDRIDAIFQKQTINTTKNGQSIGSQPKTETHSGLLSERHLIQDPLSQLITESTDYGPDSELLNPVYVSEGSGRYNELMSQLYPESTNSGPKELTSGQDHQGTSEDYVLTANPESVVLNTGKLGQLSSAKTSSALHSLFSKDTASSSNEESTQQQESSQQENTQQSMSGIFGVTGNGSNRPGSAQWQLSESSTTQQQESSQQENTQQSMSGIFGSTGNGSTQPGSAQWQLSESSTTQQQESSQQENTQQENTQQESSQLENTQQVVKDILPSADSEQMENVVKNQLRRLVTEIAAGMKQLDSATPHYEIENRVVQILKQRGTAVFDEMALRKTIRQILAEAYPDAYTPTTHPDDRKRDVLLDKTLRQLVIQTIKRMEKEDFSAQKETIAEGLLNKIKEDGTLIIDEAALKQQILRLIEEMFPSGRDSGYGNNNSTGEDDDEGFEEFPANQPLYDGYTIGSYELKNLSSNNGTEIILESVVEVKSFGVLIRCKSVVWDANIKNFTVRCLDTGEYISVDAIECDGNNIGIMTYTNEFTAGHMYEISNGLSSLRFTVRAEEGSLHFDTIQTISYPNGVVSNDSVLKMTLKGSQFNIPTFELPSSQKKPSGLHSITYEDGVLKVGTAVEPTDSVKQAIQREGTEDTDWYIDWYIFKMPEQPVNVSSEIKDNSRTITVVSRGKTVATYEFQPGDDLSNFDAAGDLEMPAPEEHLKLAGWQWKREGSDRWMETPSVMPNENLVLTSLWWPEEYSVTCNGEKTWVPFGHDLYPPAVETPEGMVFDHWEWTVEGSTVVIDKPYTMPACNLIATPFWTPRAYCLTVNGAATQVLYGTALAEPAAPEAPEGHSFGGWKWTVGGAEAAKPAAMPACDVTAEPIWTANTYTLTINGAATQVTVGTPLAEPAAPEAPEGHSFGGWKWTVGGAEAAKPDTMPGCNVTAEPIWTRNAYTLTFIGNEDGTVLLSQSCYYGDTIPYPANPTREGREFTGWDFTGTTMPAHDLTITAIWKVATPPTPEEPETPTKYTVTFTLDGKELIGSEQYAEGDTIAPPPLPDKYVWTWTADWVMPAYDITINAVKPEL